MHRPRREVVFFVAVGAAAAFTHWSVVRALVQAAALPPLAANVLGFAVAFGVSYLGHYRLSFRSSAAHAQALPRFAAVALGGFVLNEALYALLLHVTALRYDVALALVLLSVAGLTYLASRGWAFRDRRPPQ